MSMRKKEDVLTDIQKTKMRMEEVDKVYDFTSTIVKKFGTFIKAVAVFGSFAKKTESESSDTDVAVIVDDSFGPMDKALYVAFQTEMNSLMKLYPKLHLNTVSISQFWDSVRRGDPLAIQMLRDGVALYDLGFFVPLKRLLIQGKIRPTDEAVNAALSRAFFNANNYTSVLLNGVHTLYWAAVEAAHAGVMKYGKISGSPHEMTGLLKETLLKDKILTEDEVKVYERIFSMEKEIEKGDLTYIEAEKLEKAHKEVIKFVTKIDAWINREGIKKTLGSK